MEISSCQRDEWLITSTQPLQKTSPTLRHMPSSDFINHIIISMSVLYGFFIYIKYKFDKGFQMKLSLELNDQI